MSSPLNSNIHLRRALDAAVSQIGASLATVSEAIRAKLRNRLCKELDRYETTLHRQATRLGDVAQQDGTVSFALNELAPARLNAIKSYLSPESDPEYLHLLQYLDVLNSGLSHDISRASSPEEVGDALLRSLDNLHDYVLAHKVVRAGYLRAQDLLGPDERLEQLARPPRQRREWAFAPDALSGSFSREEPRRAVAA